MPRSGFGGFRSLDLTIIFWTWTLHAVAGVVAKAFTTFLQRLMALVSYLVLKCKGSVVEIVLRHSLRFSAAFWSTALAVIISRNFYMIFARQSRGRREANE